MHRNPHVSAMWRLVVLVLILAACTTPPEVYSADGQVLSTAPLPDAREAGSIQGISIEEQNAAATAEIARLNAQATLNAANATLGAAQTLEQNNADAAAAHLAATAEFERAQALATLQAAGSTQGAAQTQDAILQTRISGQVTVLAAAALDQQQQDAVAAATQTAVANSIATQTRAADATSQWYDDQARQRDEQRSEPVTFLWVWCLPVFVLLFAVLVLWGFWRRLKNRQDNLHYHEEPAGHLHAATVEVPDHQHAPPVELPDHQHAAPPAQPGTEIIEDRYQLTTPADPVGRWIDEVKRKLLISDRKEDEDDARP
jgi:hypothetical protein